MRYLLFGGYDLRSTMGGAHEYLACDEDKVRLSELSLLNKKENRQIQWWHIFDTKNKEIVTSSIKQAYGAVDYDDSW